MLLGDIKLYHGGVEEYRHGPIFATPTRRIAEGYAILSYYTHRKLGERTKPIVEVGTGRADKLDHAHDLSYLMAEWNVLATDKVKAVRVPLKANVCITSFCGSAECPRYFTGHTCYNGGETKLAFVYCLCDEAESPRLDKEYVLAWAS